MRRFERAYHHSSCIVSEILMPRDTDNSKDAGGRRGRSEGGKGRSGAARGPEKKFAKRGVGGKPGEAKSFAPKSFGAKSAGAKSFGGKSFGAKSEGDRRPASGDRPFRKRDDHAAGDKPRFNRDDKPRDARSRDDRPRTDRPRSDRPYSDRPARSDDGEKRAFKPRGDRPKFDRDGGGDKRPYTPRDGGGEKRPYTPRDGGGDKRPYTPRDRDGEKRPYTPRGNRDEARPAARSPDRKFGERKPYAAKPYASRDRDGDQRPSAPRGEGFRDRNDRPRSDRPFSERPSSDRPTGERKFGERPARTGDRPERKFGGDKKFSRGAPDRGGRGPRKSEGADRNADRGDRKSFGDRPPRRDFSDRPSGGDSKPWQKREPASDRPERSARPPRDFDRPREERPKFERPRQRSEGNSDWHEHPRNERATGGFAERPRRENEDDSKVFAKRPAFGGRGAYRERKPEDDKRKPRRDAEPREDIKSTKAGERIAKVVARAGLASRRDSEEMIVQGRVAVNGRVINSPALDVTTSDVITIDGKPLPARERTRLILYYKPRGLMTTHSDPEGRPTVFDNLPEHLPRVISIGRLDFNTEGLLLLTNDGGLARVLELPETGWMRRYRVRAHGEVTQAQLDQLRDGVEVEGIKYGPIEASLERDQGANVWLVVAIREGKNREVRNVLAHLGLEVNRLIRISYGPFQLGELEEGQVQEIKTRVLREQLGEKVIEQAGADFGESGKSQSDHADREPLPPPKPKVKREVVADRKGRRVLVQRTGSEESRARNEAEARFPGTQKRPKRGYHGKRDLKPLDE